MPSARDRGAGQPRPPERPSGVCRAVVRRPSGPGVPESGVHLRGARSAELPRRGGRRDGRSPGIEPGGNLAADVDGAASLQDPLLAWSFDEPEGSIVKDALGRGNDGRLAGHAQRTGGRRGGGVRLDGEEQLRRHQQAGADSRRLHSRPLGEAGPFSAELCQSAVKPQRRFGPEPSRHLAGAGRRPGESLLSRCRRRLPLAGHVDNDATVPSGSTSQWSAAAAS